MKPITNGLLIFLAILLLSCFTGNNDSTKENSNCVTKEFTNVDKSNKYAFTLNGTVYNNCGKDVNGYVKIKFIDSNGDIRHTAKARVNDGDYFSDRQSAPYHYSAKPIEFIDINTFEVVFIAR
jgi:hypothetical protein